jgi:hypothetical protein
MGAVDYATAMRRWPHVGPVGLPGLLALAAAPLPATDLIVYLVDFEQVVLQPLLLDPASPVVVEEEVATTMAGRAFRTGAPVTADRDGAVRVWVPIVEGADRTGVLALTVPTAAERLIEACTDLGRFAGLLVTTAARRTDLVHARRRARTMTVAAGMQWDLLPPLTLRERRVVSSGVLEPAYQIAGDGFDHVLNGDWFNLGVFDAMGHGVTSTLLTALAVGAYRSQRRSGESLCAAHKLIDDTIFGQWDGEAFVTGLLARLHLPSGRLEWTNAGHPPPLLLRDRRVVGSLSCPPTLPFGLRDAAPVVAVDTLHPGDSLLLYTDGAVDGRGDDGEAFGEARLIDLLEREAIPDRSTEEILRRLVQAVIAHQAGKLTDDATLVLLRWIGPSD